MKIVIKTHTTIGETLEIVEELRRQGYCQGNDFDFAYYPSRWDEMIGDIPQKTIFTFYNDTLATWFQLKYM